MKIRGILVIAFVFTPVLTIGQTDEQRTSVTWFGFSQITAEAGHGVAKMEDGSDNGVRFGADRVRIGFKAKRVRAFAKLQVDFNRSDVSRITAGMPDIIKDAEVGYVAAPVASFKAGIFKTPVGMDFNSSGTKLDITKRGMEKALVLERALGVMASGRKVLGGLGYDIGVFNPATRSSAVFRGTPGLDYAYAVRGLYEKGESFHAELSFGLNEKAAGDGTEDYTVWDAAASYRMAGITVKGEWISGTDMYGDDGYDQWVGYLHVGYRVGSRFEPVIRHYQGKSERDGSQLGNTFIGLNVFLNPEQPHTARLQLNFVLTGETKGQMGEDWSGLGGYTKDAFLAQFQFAF